MNSTPSSQPAVPRNVAGHVPGHIPGSAPGSIPSAILPGDTGFHPASPLAQGVPASAELGPRRVGYGLPCVKCKTYYAADLSACPVCKTEERVLPMPLASVNSSPRLAGALPPSTEDIALEEEREQGQQSDTYRPLGAQEIYQPTLGCAATVAEYDASRPDPWPSAGIYNSTYKSSIRRPGLRLRSVEFTLSRVNASRRR